MKWWEESTILRPSSGPIVKDLFSRHFESSLLFFLERGGGRERRRTRRNFADNERADIDLDGQLGLRGPPGRICTRHTTNHFSISSTTANVLFFSPHNKIQPSLFLPLSLLSRIPSFYGRGSLISWIIFPRVVCRVETLETLGEKRARGRKREREIRTVERVRMPYTSLRLEYIGDDNATIAAEKDTRMLRGRKRRYKETRNTLTRIPPLLSSPPHLAH